MDENIKALYELPKPVLAELQDYILHIDSCFATLVTKDLNKIIEIIKKDNLIISEIKTERNFHGLKDFRIICKSSVRTA